MSRTLVVRRSLAATTVALVVAGVGATSLSAAADPGNGNGNGQSQSHQGDKDKGDKDKGPKDKGDKDKGPKDKGDKDKGPKDKGDKDQGDKDKGPKDKGPKGPTPGNGGGNSGDGNGGGHNPAGNNGTIKIDGVEFDDAPNNEPHPGCIFQVDFYGFDAGQNIFADLTFEAHAPTTSPSGDNTLLNDSIFIGEDDASGGGSEAGLDAERTYELDFGDIEPHPKQGYHVKLTVNADGSQGADTKHKVFWVEPCEDSTTPETLPETETETEAGGAGDGEDDAEVAGAGAGAGERGADKQGSDSTDDTEVLGEQASAAAAPGAQAAQVDAAAAAAGSDVPNAVDAGDEGNPVLDFVRSPLPMLTLVVGALLVGFGFLSRRRNSSV